MVHELLQHPVGDVGLFQVVETARNTGAAAADPSAQHIQGLDESLLILR
jgi:hypothetical protein